MNNMKIEFRTGNYKKPFSRTKHWGYGCKKGEREVEWYFYTWWRIGILGLFIYIIKK